MLGEDYVGEIEFGAGQVFQSDPGQVAGYEDIGCPSFRTFTVPKVERTFAVPASDRYALLSARVGGVSIGSKLDFAVDWRAWLGGDIIGSSYWTDIQGELVDDDAGVEDGTGEEGTDTEPEVLEPITWNGEVLTDASGETIAWPMSEPIIEEPIEEPIEDGETTPTAVLESGRTLNGVASIRHLVRKPVTMLQNSITTLRGRKDERTMTINASFLESGRLFEQDPAATLDYKIDFSALLESDERLYGTQSDMLLYGSRLTPRCLNAADA